jgi:hypothetical protein
MPPRTDIKCVSFAWEKADPALYDLQGGTARFREEAKELYRPALAALELKPNTGKYWWEWHANHENLRMGVALADCDLSSEMGKGAGTWSINIQTGVCETNGKEFKKLWRLIVPVSGGKFGFLYDTDNGTMQIYFNGEFHGTAFNADAGLKGLTVRPAIGIGALEAHNRNIGIGKKRVIVREDPELVHNLVQ